MEGNPVNLTDPTGHTPWWCIYAPNPTECVNKWYDNSDRIWVDHLNNLYANIDRVWENKCSEPDTISTPIIILGCGAGNNPCGSSEYGLFEYKSWAASEGFVVYVEGFPGWYGGVKNEVAKNMVNDIAENPGKTVVFIGHSAGADSVIIAMSQLSAEVKVAAIVLMDPTLINGDNTLTLPSGNNVKLYDTAFDGVSILPFDQQLDGNLRKRWPNEQNLHQALAKDGVVKDDAIAFIEARLAQ